MAKTTPWAKIKAEYLQGVTPKELAEKYKITAKTIHEKASHEGWVEERTSIYKNLQAQTQEQISRITKLALRRLEDVLSDENLKPGDIIQAIGKAIDVSGLKSSKQEITGDIITTPATFNILPVKGKDEF